MVTHLPRFFHLRGAEQLQSAEKYDVQIARERYVKVTVTGNTQNNWVSINEIDVYAGTSAATADQVPLLSKYQPGHCDTGVQLPSQSQLTFNEPVPASSVSTYSFIVKNSADVNTLASIIKLWHDATFNPASSLAFLHRNSYNKRRFKRCKGLAGNARTSDKSGHSLLLALSGNTGGTDKFGIKKIYDTKSAGEEWYMDMNNPNGDNRFNPQNTITKNSDGSWKMKSSKVRMGVYTSSGYSSSKIPTLDHSKIASKGYMLAPNDWKNIEMTMYTKVNKAGSDDNFAPYGRGGRHTGGGAPEGCEGSAYKGDLFFSGKVRFAKEQWHVSYVFTNYETGTSSIKGKWVGFKFVLYNFQDSNGKTAVKMEFWLDKSNDGNFVKVDENIDKGGWGNEGKECNGAPDQIITWGGPIATFRWDTATDVDFKNLSVREIQPPQ